jgi:thiol-disulfide isomerase/thioredoxin
VGDFTREAERSRKIRRSIALEFKDLGINLLRDPQVAMKNTFHLSCFALASVVASLFVVSCKSAAANPEAVGTVTWGRDFDSALSSAKKTGKPVFLLFQEVPGCAGCRQFGRDVLSDPNVVTAIQEHFTPLLIPNNRPGKDAEILAHFDEPAFNYQVVRFLDADGHDLIPRKDHVWEALELTQRMKDALKKAGRDYVARRSVKQVAIAQNCFWEGEMKIGAIEGVTRTEAGFLDGNEVTLVDFDPVTISAEDLAKKAKAAGVASGVYTALEAYQKAPASDQKRQLQGTPYAALKLTPEQATKVNAFVRSAPERVVEFLGK